MFQLSRTQTASLLRSIPIMAPATTTLSSRNLPAAPQTPLSLAHRLPLPLGRAQAHQAAALLRPLLRAHLHRSHPLPLPAQARRPRRASAPRAASARNPGERVREEVEAPGRPRSARKSLLRSMLKSLPSLASATSSTMTRLPWPRLAPSWTMHTTMQDQSSLSVVRNLRTVTATVAVVIATATPALTAAQAQATQMLRSALRPSLRSTLTSLRTLPMRWVTRWPLPSTRT